MDYGKVYGALHSKGKYFPGFSITPYVGTIQELVALHQPESLLDYGSGRGLQYLKRRVHEAWGGLLPHCYDIGVRGLDDKPGGTFGGTICTDVAEHIEEADVPLFLTELANYTADGGFLFLSISCRPTKKRLPDGRDVHVTIRPPSWWIDKLKALVARKALDGDDLRVVAAFDVAGHFPGEADHVWWSKTDG